MTDVFKIIVKYRQKIIAKYRHLSPSGNRALELHMMSKELQNSDLIYVNLMTDVFKIIIKYCQKIIAKYRHLSPNGNRA